MTKKESEVLKSAYEDVFDQNDNVKVCGRIFCQRLMYILSKYTKKDLGNFSTGVMNIETVKSEYHRLVGWLSLFIKSCLFVFKCDFLLAYNLIKNSQFLYYDSV